MGILQINYKTTKEKNNNLGYIIKKNPNTNMILRKIRKGIAYGWYSNNNQSYNVYFKDADNEVSYGNQEFEYLDTKRYNAIQLYQNILNEFFSSTLKNISEEDKETIGKEKEIYINLIYIKNIKDIIIFQKYFNEKYKIEITHIEGKSYKLNIKTKQSFYELFNFFNILTLFLILSAIDEFIEINEDTIKKYINSINIIDAPYFIRYIFSTKMLKNRKMFEKYKQELSNIEKDKGDKIELKYGDTATQRKDIIKNILLGSIEWNNHIVDIGCGEGAYALDLSKKISVENKDYIAIDIDENVLDKLKNKILNIQKTKTNNSENKELYKNIKIFNNIDKYITSIKNSQEKVNVLMTEVIEHMDIEESIKLLNKIKKLNFKNLIITVPNKEFNKYYLLEENEFRHYDHNWEPTKKEFKDLMEKVYPKSLYNKEFIEIGDKVNDISTTLGCVIKIKVK